MKAFESSEVPILAVDVAGTVRYANRATADLFAPPGELVTGRPCWKITRLRSADGGRFCCRECPVQREASLGRVPAVQHVTLSTGHAAPHRFDLMNFLVPPAHGNGGLVLHLLVPSSDPAAGSCAAAPRAVPKGGRLHLLTPRELEVLDALATGLDAVDVADRLAITLNTARNHIRNILAKLCVHRQVDAILLRLRCAAGDRH
jgi:DNA-binding CsgD family transcriptional regulator